MRKLQILLFTILAMVLIGNTTSLAQALRGNGNIISESRALTGITGLDVSGGFTVEITQGSNEGIRLEAESNLIGNIVTEVRNGVLHIYNDESITTSKPMKAYVTLKQLERLYITGGVKVTAASTIKSERLRMDLSGGSSVKLALDASTLEADLSGASRVNITGQLSELVAVMSGASKLEAQEVEVKDARVRASGASIVKVMATEKLDVDASGASVVYYAGSPRVSTSVSGAARVGKLN